MSHDQHLAKCRNFVAETSTAHKAHKVQKSMLLGAPGIATRSKDATGSKGTRFFAHSVPSLSAQAVSVVSFSSLLPPNSAASNLA